MKVHIKGSVPLAGNTVAELREALASFPQDATIRYFAFGSDELDIAWEEER